MNFPYSFKYHGQSFLNDFVSGVSDTEGSFLLFTRFRDHYPSGWGEQVSTCKDVGGGVVESSKVNPVESSVISSLGHITWFTFDFQVAGL